MESQIYVLLEVNLVKATWVNHPQLGWTAQIEQVTMDDPVTMTLRELLKGSKAGDKLAEKVRETIPDALIVKPDSNGNGGEETWHRQQR